MGFDYTAQFEQMRPYLDSEYKEMVGRFTTDPLFPIVIKHLYPEVDAVELAAELQGFGSIDEFQKKFMHRTGWRILENCKSSLSIEGLENLDPNKAYLFIANHRDIVLDSTFMQMALVASGNSCTQITFGSNLMFNQFVVDFGKLNRMFVLYRGGSRIQMYRNSLLHSAYMHDVITRLHESVWIAQRNGRTKDGDDKTQAALIKMLLGTRHDAVNMLMEFNIVPVVVSYEWEPCARQKVHELFNTVDGVYQKQPGEDLDSVLTGILAHKGRIRLTFGKPVNEMLGKLDASSVDTTTVVDQVVDDIDRQIYQLYQLWPNNYVAADLLNGSGEHGHRYTAAEKACFVDYLEKQLALLPDGDKDALREMFLKLYANPVFNQQMVNSPVGKSL